jgi:intracellular multiplication protein IcmB
MNLINKFIDGIDDALDYAGHGIKTSISDYCDLETADDPYSFVARDGSLVTVIEILGSSQMINNNTLRNNIIYPLVDKTSHSFKNKGYKLQAFFECDPQRTEEEIEAALSGSRSTADRLELDFSDLIDEDVKHLSKYVKSEHTYFALWTTDESINKAEKKRLKEERIKSRKDYPNIKSDGQDPMKVYPSLKNRHRSYVDNFLIELDTLGIVSKRLNVLEASRVIRHCVDSSIGAKSLWNASLPNEAPLPAIRKKKMTEDNWDILWPSLSKQLCPSQAKILSSKYVQVGNRVYAPQFIKLFPGNPKPFSDLFQSLRVKSIPWRFSMLIEGGGLDGLGLKGAIASILVFSNSGNKLLTDSIDALKNYFQGAEGSVVSIRCTVCTWASKGKLTDLERRASELKESVESWGTCEVGEVVGDPLGGLASSSLAMTRGNIGTMSACPYVDALGMLPLSRPTSPFESGSVLLRTPDEKLMPVESYSKNQASWTTIIFAKPGYGKSFLINLLNFGLVLKSGIEVIPRISILDIGPSSSGFALAVKEALPEKKKHLAVYKKLRNVPEDSINPFDLPVGCRYPISSHMAFLINWLTLVVTDPAQTTPEKNMIGMVQAIIDEMYNIRSDRGQPNPYRVNKEILVDEAIKKVRYSIKPNTTWFEVVDALALAGYMTEATIAQKHTSPLLSDASLAAASAKVKSEYDDMIPTFNRSLNEAIRTYHFLSKPSVIDFSDARVVSLDLDELARGGGPAGDRMVEVAYLTGMFAVTNDFYTDEESADEMPAPANMLLRETVPTDLYKEYHRKRFKATKGEPKRLCCDELWRIGKAEMVNLQLMNNVRIGRKYKVENIFASQFLKDFNKEMTEAATSIYIMAPPSPDEKEQIRQAFGIHSDAENEAIERGLRMPRPGAGGVFLAKYQTSTWFASLLSATAGPIKYWASTTTVEDTEVRKRVYQRFGGKIARRILARTYPTGAKNEVEARQRNMKKSMTEFNSMDDDALASGIYDTIAGEIISTYESRT